MTSAETRRQRTAHLVKGWGTHSGHNVDGRSRRVSRQTVLVVAPVASQRCLDLPYALLILVRRQRDYPQSWINWSPGRWVIKVARHEVRVQVWHQVAEQIDVHFRRRK